MEVGELNKGSKIVLRSIFSLSIISSILASCYSNPITDLNKPPNNYEFAINSNVPQEDVVSIYNAIDEWKLCFPIITASISNDVNALQIAYRNSIDPTSPGLITCGITICQNDGCVGCIGSITQIYYDHTCSNDETYTQRVIAHEMGHVFGLGHFGDEHELMNARLSLDGIVRQGDCDALAAIHNK
jgi:Metallo-peptidase family M12B Reprolysin-like